MSGSIVVADVFGSFSDAISFIFEPQPGPRVAADDVGGLAEVWGFMWTQIWISVVALAIACAVAIPAGVYFGHRGTGEFLAVALGNAGRAIPELILIALMVAFIGVGPDVVTIALLILGIPPILTNTFVGVRQVDRNAIDAARGMGMTELEVIRKVELPLAVPTLMSGVRTGAIAIVSTATIASLAGVTTLGDYIINRGLYGDTGLLAGAILVAVLALVFELVLAGVQRLLTPHGLRLERQAARATA
jgi:osmoprotectant transport system permease protein